MAVTSTAIVATDCVVQLDNSSGSLTDISGASNSVEIAFEHGVGEYRPFSTQWQQRKVVGKDCTISMTVVYTTEDTEPAQLLNGWFFGGDDSARSVQIDIPDSTVGSERFSGEFVLTSLSIPLDSEADDVVRVSVELASHGAVSRADISS
jgi:predicted secreted protein